MESASEAIWNPALAGFVLAAALVLTLATLLVQVRQTPRGIRAWIASAKNAVGAPMLLASSASVGTITAAGLAVTTGGPGALVWMWIATAVGLALPFGEAALAARTHGEHRGIFVKAAAPFGSVLGSLFIVGLVAAGVAAGGLFQGHEVAEVLRLTLRTTPAVGAGLAAAFAGAIVFVPAVRRFAFIYAVPMAIALWVSTTLGAALEDPLVLELALGDAWNQAFGLSAAATGTGSGAVAALVHHGVLRTVMATELGTGTAAMSYAEARESSNSAAKALPAGAAAMLVPLVTSALIATTTALAMLGASAEPDVIIEPRLVPLERHQSRGLRPSTQVGQTVVLPVETPLEAGKFYSMRVRSSPRGHRFARLMREDNSVILPAWATTSSTDTVVFRSKNPELAKRAAWDVRVPCEREVLESPGSASILKLTPKEEGVDFGKVIAYFELDPQPYVLMDDFDFVGAVDRATSPDPELGEHLALFERKTKDRANNPKLHEFFRGGYRGPYAADDGPRPPWGFVTTPAFTPPEGGTLDLEFRADPRGNALVSINRVGGVEGPPWDLLLEAKTLILRHATDPEQDIRIPVTTKLDRYRVRFVALDTEWEDFRKVTQMEDYSGPYVVIPDYRFSAEVHGDERLNPKLAGRRTIVPVHEHGEISGPLVDTPYRPHPGELLESGVAGPFMHREGIGQIAARVHRYAPSWGGTVFAIVAFILGSTTIAAWSLYVRRGLTASGLTSLAMPLSVVVLIAGAGGAFVAADAVLHWAELAYGIAVAPTLVGLVLLFGDVRAASRGGGDADT